MPPYCDQVVVIELCTYVNIYGAVLFRYIHFTICKLYSNFKFYFNLIQLINIENS